MLFVVFGVKIHIAHEIIGQIRKEGDFTELNIKDKITFLRERYGFTQETVSKMLNIKRATYAKYENGQAKNLPNKIIYQLAKIYNVSADYFFSLDVDKTSKNYRLNDASGLISRDEIKFISIIRLVPKEKRDELFNMILEFANDSQDENSDKNSKEQLD